MILSIPLRCFFHCCSLRHCVSAREFLFKLILCLALLCSVTATGNCDPSYRLHFEVTVEEGAGKRTIRTSSDVVSGVPLAFKTGRNILSLLFSVEPPPSDEFLLTVSLSPIEKIAHDLSTPLSTRPALDSNVSLLKQTFHSRLVGGKNGPFEFEMEQNGCKVSGVIALSLLR